MDKRNLLLERDFLLFDPWDAMRTNEPQDKLSTFRKNSAVGITIRVFGTFGISDLTGKETIEDMEVWLGDGEITNGLPEDFLQSLVDACLEEA